MVSVSDNEELTIPEAYKEKELVKFDMKMYVDDAPVTELKVPVVITLPVPAKFDTSKPILVLHYHEGDAPVEIKPAVVTDASGSYVKFVVDGFRSLISWDVASMR